MSVLIKGMEMPTNCDACLFDDGVHCMAYSPSEDMVYDIADGKPSWCPLITLPDHGRLIDADALEHIIGQFSLNWEYGQGVSDCWDALINAPAIIPAEEGE